MLDFTRSFDLPGREEKVLEWLDKQVSILNVKKVELIIQITHTGLLSLQRLFLLAS